MHFYSGPPVHFLSGVDSDADQNRRQRRQRGYYGSDAHVRPGNSH
jgi:hypothetical protein